MEGVVKECIFTMSTINTYMPNYFMLFFALHSFIVPFIDGTHLKIVLYFMAAAASLQNKEEEICVENSNDAFLIK